MNHPNPEEWMSYLYDEMNTRDRAGLAAHLEACPDCRTRVAEYHAVRSRLGEWQFSLPEARPRPAFARTAWKWAVAASIALIAAFGVGRSSGSGDARAEMQQEVREQVRSARLELQQEFVRLLHAELDKAAATTLEASQEQGQALLANYDDTLETRRLEEKAAWYAALKKMESEWALDYLSLKKELDTVAVNTDAGLRHTEQRLIQLAGYTRPDNFPNSTQK